MSISDEKAVSFTTYRKIGIAVSTPVWIVGLDDGRVGFYTSSTSGKAKRLRNNPTVALQPSDQRGRVKPGSSPVTGTAVLVSSGPVFDEIQAKIKQKYGVFAKIAPIAARIGMFFTRKKFPYADVVVAVTLD